MARMHGFPGGGYPLGVAQFPGGNYPLGWPRGAVRRRVLSGLGDDTPDTIRVYVPRLASGLHALEVRQAGKTYAGAPPAMPFEARRWMDGIQKVFQTWALWILGFNPIVHEEAGADVIYVHMPGAQTHADAERMWRPFQLALNAARRETGTPAPGDPYAGQPRSWQAAPPPPMVQEPAPVETLAQSAWDLAAGAGMLLLAVAL